MFASGTGFAEFLHKGAEVWPDIFPVDKLLGFVLSKVAREDVFVFVLKDLEAKIHDIQNINPVKVAEKTCLIYGPVGVDRCQKMCG